MVLIVVDTLRADYTEPHTELASTPHIQALAADGVRFARAFAHVPITLPSHASLFSSRLPVEHGVRENAELVPKDLPLLAAWLAQHGYTCQAEVSLASMWPQASGRGLDRGFERYGRGEWAVTRGESLNWELATTLDQLVKRQPFFLFAHFSDPHEPYESHGTAEHYADVSLDGRSLGAVLTSDYGQIRRELWLSPGDHVLDVSSKFAFKVRLAEFKSPSAALETQFAEGVAQARTNKVKLRVRNPSASKVLATLSLWLHDAPGQLELPGRYRSEVEYADRCLGELIAELKRRDLYDSSTIILTSDHGEGLGEHGTFGHIVHLYDELLRVPLIIKLPDRHAAQQALAKSKNELARLIDVAPTLLELLDLPAMPDQEGVSLLRPNVPRLLVAQTQRRGTQTAKELYCIRDRQYKLIWTPKTKLFEMYDVAEDPGELADVFTERGNERSEWQETLKALASGARREGETAIDPELQQRLDSLGYGGE